MTDQEINSIFELKEVTNVDCQLYAYDNQILFYPVLPSIEEALTINEKSIEPKKNMPWEREIVYRKREMYSKCERERGVIGVTFPGFLQRIIRVLVMGGYTFNLQDLRIANDTGLDFPKPRLDLMWGFRFSQQALITTALQSNMSGLVGAPTRYGKCLVRGTKVLMHDNSTKVVEDIVVGDKLMGPDWAPRTVTALGAGEEQAYTIVPHTRDPFSCNASHILHLATPLGAVNVSVIDYLNSPQLCRDGCRLLYANADGSRTRSTFTVRDIGVQPYHGFELEGSDKLFLLHDRCITHNTTLMINTLRAYPNLVTVVTAPGVDLVHQLYEDITDKQRGITNREVKLICSGSRTRIPSDTGITVCSADSLSKCDMGATELLLADEPHALVTEGRLSIIDQFPKARRIGFGATLTGRFDNKDLLIEGVFGPVIASRTYKEAVAEGAICPLHIIFVKVELQPEHFSNRDQAYEKLLFKSSEMANLTSRICKDVIPQDWQTLVFIKHEKQADLYLDAIGSNHTIAMAKRMNKTQRAEIAQLMKDNVIKRCLCTKIYVQGVTFRDVRVLINAEAGGNNTSAIQKPGRLAEVRENKKCGIVIDFMFVPPPDVNLSDYSGEPWTFPCRDSASRYTAYEDKGYDIHEVSSVDELKSVFNEIA